MKLDRRFCLLAALLLIGGLALPASRAALESSMATHMLVQIPLLAIGGVLFGLAVPPRVQRVILPYNGGGVPGLLLFVFVSSYWMLPRALDGALASPIMELAKFFSLPLLAGLTLALSWPRASLVGRGFIVANAISMLAVVGWLYRVSPVRLCNYYLMDQQVTLGNALLWLALLLGFAFGARLFTGAWWELPPNHPATAASPG